MSNNKDVTNKDVLAIVAEVRGEVAQGTLGNQFAVGRQLNLGDKISLGPDGLMVLRFNVGGALVVSGQQNFMLDEDLIEQLLAGETSIAELLDSGTLSPMDAVVAGNIIASIEHSSVATDLPGMLIDQVYAAASKAIRLVFLASEVKPFVSYYQLQDEVVETSAAAAVVFPSANETVFINTLQRIMDAAEADTAAGLRLADYKTAGIAGVSTLNFSAINSVLDTAAINAEAINSKAKLQALVDVYNGVLQAADSQPNQQALLNGLDFKKIGLSDFNSSAVKNLFTSVIDHSPPAQVDGIGKIEQLLNAVVAVIQAAGNDLFEVGLDQLALLGLDGVNPQNLSLLQSLINSSNSDGSGLDSLPKLITLVSTAQDHSSDLARLVHLAETNTASDNNPSQEFYQGLGVHVSSVHLLKLINSAVNSPQLAGDDFATTQKVQELISSLEHIQQGQAGVDDFDRLGIEGIVEGQELTLLNQLLAQTPSAEKVRLIDIQIKHDAIASLLDGLAGVPGKPSLQELATLGLEGFNERYLGLVQEAIREKGEDANALSDLADLQTIINTVLDGVAEAVIIISEFAEDNSASDSNPGLDLYSQAAIADVDMGNLQSINSALNSAGVDASNTHTDLLIQVVVDSYNQILAAADGNADNSKLGAQELINIGIRLPVNPVGIDLLVELLDLKDRIDVDTVAEIQLLADAASAVMDSVKGVGVPTQAELERLGISGIVTANMPAIINALAASKDDGSDVSSLNDLQVLINNTTVATNLALAEISNAAENNNAGIATPDLITYINTGVSGVSSGNLAAINSALNSAVIDGAAADTPAEIQAIVDAFNKILAAADGLDDDDSKPLSSDYSAIGINTVDTAFKQSLIGDVIDQKMLAEVDSVAKLTVLAATVAQLFAAAAGGPALSQAQLESLGLEGINPDNLPVVLRAIDNSADNGSAIQTLPGLQILLDAVINAANSALAVLSSAAQNNSASAGSPAASVYFDAGVTGVHGGNLPMLNDALNQTSINADKTDTRVEVQQIVDAYNAILSAADGIDNAGAKPSAANYLAIAVTGMDGASELSLLGDVLDLQSNSAVQTVAQIQAWADIVQTIIASSSGTAGLTLSDLTTLGIVDVSAANFPVISAALAATTDGGLDIASLSQLQSVVSAVGPGVLTLAISGQSGGQNQTLNAGDTVQITVTMTESTAVTGSPQLALNIAGSTVYANYLSGTGSSSLVFSYTVQAGDNDGNGISIDANALQLNGGSLKDAGGNDAALGHLSIGHNPDYLVDSSAPAVVISFASNVLAAGDTTLVTFSFSERPMGFSEADISLANGSLSGFTVTADDQVYTATFTPTASTEDASNIISVGTGYLDAAGNSGSGGNSANYQVDTLAPSISSLLVSADDVINSSDVLTAVGFSGTTSGVEDGQAITVVIAGVSTVVTVNSGVFNGAANLSAVADSNSLMVTANVTDNAGNPAVELSKTIVKDVALPVISTLLVSSDDVINSSDSLSTVAFSGNTSGIEDGQTITVIIGGLSTSATVSSNTFNGFANLIVVADTDSLAVSADVSDSAGNAAVQLSKTIIKDVVAPSGPSFSAAGLSFGAAVTSFPATESWQAVFGDVDGDGDLDLYVPTQGATSLWLNDGAGGFTQDLSFPSGSGIYTSAVFADIDNDTDLDLVVTHTFGDDILFINDGSGGFTGQTLSSSTASSKVITADVNGDGFSDFLTTEWVGIGKNHLFINNQAGGFSSSDIGSSSSIQTMSSTFIDVDNDGDQDLFFSNYDAANELWLNDGSGGYTQAVFAGAGLSESSREVVAADFNGDGFQDLYVSNNSSQQNRLWLNNGDGTFTGNDISGDLGNSFGVDVGDLDGDGDVDLYIANGASEANKLWLNDGSGQFSAPATAVDNIGQNSYGVRFADVNGDGKLDIYVSNSGDNDRLYLNGSGGLNTNDTTPLISVDISADAVIGDIVRLYSAGELIASFTLLSSGAQSVALTIGNVTAGDSLSAASFLLDDGSGGFKLSDTSHSVSAKITDVAGNQSAASSPTTVTIDSSAAVINSVALTAAAGSQGNFLNAGDTLSITVNLTEVVNVTGTPQLALDIGGTAVLASYSSGSGSSNLVFIYTVLASQTDLNGISIVGNSLSLNGGSIADNFGNATLLSHAAVTDNSSYQVDTSAPTVSSVAISSSSLGAGNILSGGDSVTVTLALSDNISLNTAGGTPSVDLIIGSSTVSVAMTGSTSNSLVFTYTLLAGQADVDGIAISASSLTANGALLTDAAGNTLLLNHAGVSSDADFNVNAKPVNMVPGAQSVNEDTGLVFNGGNTISIADDDGNLASAQLSVSQGVLNLSLSGSAAITGGSNGGSSLTISGNQADINATLASLTYIAVNNYHGADVLTLLSMDSAGTPLSDSDTVAITVTPVNDAPTINDLGATLAYTEGDGAQVIDASISLVDVDDSHLESAIISMGTGFVSAEDVLAFTNANGISGSYNSSSGVLTLSGNATVADYAAALESITYTNTNTANPNTGNRSINWVVNDGDDTSIAATSTITVAGNNDAPSLALGQFKLDFDGSSDYLDVPTITSSAGLYQGGSYTGLSIVASVKYDVFTSWTKFFNISAGGINNHNILLGNDGVSSTLVFEIYVGGLGKTIRIENFFQLGVEVHIGVTQASDGTVTIYKNGVAIDPAIETVYVDYVLVNTAPLNLQIPIEVDLIGNTIGHSPWGNALFDGTLDDVALFNKVLDISEVQASMQGDFTALDSDPAAIFHYGFDGANPTIDQSGAGRDSTANGSPNQLAANAIYIEDNAATVLDNKIQLTDVDSSNLSSATVSISVGLVSGEDVLNFGDTAEITGSYNSASGILSLSGTATVAQYQAALRSVSYSNSNSVSPATGPRTISWQLNDGAAASSVQTSSLTLFVANDAPMFTVAAATLAYTEGDGAQVIDASISLADVDDSHLELAIISIGTGFVSAEDVLAFTNANGISGSYNSVSGVLTLTGNATVADYEAALESITYTNTNNANPNTANRSISWVVNDGDDASTAAASTITVAGVNQLAVLSLGQSNLKFDGSNDYLTLPTITAANGLYQGGSYTGLSIVATVKYDAMVPWSKIVSLGEGGMANDNIILGNYANSNSFHFEVFVGGGFHRIEIIDFFPLGQQIHVAVTQAANGDVMVYKNGVAIDPAQETVYVNGSLVSAAPLNIQTPDNVDLNDNLIARSHWPDGLFNGTIDSVALFGRVLSQAEVEAAAQNNFTALDNDSAVIFHYDFNQPDILLDQSVQANNALSLNGSPVQQVASAIYYEGGAGLILDGNVSLTDVDNINIGGAVITLTTGRVDSEDSLNFVNTAEISASYNSASGELTLSGTATVAQYQAALRSITYLNSNIADPNIGDRSVSWVVNDGGGDSSAVTSTIKVIGLNDTPSLTLPNNMGALALTADSVNGSANNFGATFAGSLSDSFAYDPNNPTAVLPDLILDSSEGFHADQSLDVILEYGLVSNFTQQNGANELVIDLYGRDNSINAGRDDDFDLRIYDQSGTLIGTITSLGIDDNLHLRVNVSKALGLSDGVQVGSFEVVARNATAEANNYFSLMEIRAAEIGPSYTEAGGPLIMAPTLQLADLDNSQLSSATISISNGFVSAQDVLTFVDANGISGNYNTATGVMTLSGSATVADYQAALRSISYANSNAINPNNDARTISWVVNDGSVNSAIATSVISVTPVNTAAIINTGLAVLRFDGSDDYIEVGTMLANTGLFSSGGSFNGLGLAATLTFDVFQHNNRIIDFSEVGAANDNIIVHAAAVTGNLVYAILVGGAQQNIVVEGFFVAGVETNVVVNQASDGVVTFYKDGVLIDPTVYTVTKFDGSSSSTITDPAAMTIHLPANVSRTDNLIGESNWGADDFFNGTIDDIALFGKTLSAGEITAANSQDYSSLNNDAAVVFHYGFDGADLLADQSVNQLDLISTGGPVREQVALVYTAGDGAVLLASSMQLVDYDSSHLSSATISIGGYVNGEDILTVASPNGLSVNFATATGVLTLIGKATVAEYQAALRSISYQNTSGSPTMSNKLIDFSVNDGAVASANVSIAVNMVTPLILDLDGDGIETTSMAAGVWFDIDGDGQLDRTGWVGRDDALLVRDINGDGQINGAAELFGDSTRLAGGAAAADGFAALADLDSNADGVINADDHAFAELQTWQDKNQDGKVQEGELRLLMDSGVLELSLTAVVDDQLDNGNVIGLRSSWTDTQGNQHELADVWFQYESGDQQLPAEPAPVLIQDPVLDAKLQQTLAALSQLIETEEAIFPLANDWQVPSQVPLKDAAYLATPGAESLEVSALLDISRNEVESINDLLEQLFSASPLGNPNVYDASFERGDELQGVAGAGVYGIVDAVDFDQLHAFNQMLDPESLQ